MGNKCQCYRADQRNIFETPFGQEVLNLFSQDPQIYVYKSQTKLKLSQSPQFESWYRAGYFDIQKHVREFKIFLNPKISALTNNSFEFLQNQDIDPEEVYVGQILNMKKNGIGRLCHRDNGMYEGEFKNGLYNGFGRFIYNNFVYYEGQWKDGKKHGTGKNIYFSGYEELCEWKNDSLVKIINKQKKQPQSIESKRTKQNQEQYQKNNKAKSTTFKYYNTKDQYYQYYNSPKSKSQSMYVKSYDKTENGRYKSTDFSNTKPFLPEPLDDQFSQAQEFERRRSNISNQNPYFTRSGKKQKVFDRLSDDNQRNYNNLNQRRSQYIKNIGL